MVHNDWRVYRALPSASKAMTRRSGQATAAPTATGRPWPMAPPVRHSQSWGGAPAVAPGGEQARGVALVGHDGAFGQQRAQRLRTPSGR